MCTCEQIFNSIVFEGKISVYCKYGDLVIFLSITDGIKDEKYFFMWQRVKKLTKPAKNWGPSQEDDREQYIKSLSRATNTLTNIECDPLDCEEALLQNKQKIG